MKNQPVKPKEYFRPRGRFKREHQYDIGMPLFWNKGHYDNHFLFRLFRREESEYAAFYQYHLEYFRLKNPDDGEKVFFDQVWAIVKEHIKRIKRKDNYSSRHPKDLIDKIKLQAFKKYLRGIDRWNTDKTKNQIISEQRIEILEFQLKLSELKQKLKEARELETRDYIIIRDNQVLAILDLCLKMQELKAPDGGALLVDSAQIVWAKMICKYFREDDKQNIGGVKEIKMDKVRHYLRFDPNDTKKSRVNPIPLEHNLYTINPTKKRS